MKNLKFWRKGFIFFSTFLLTSTILILNYSCQSKNNDIDIKLSYLGVSAFVIDTSDSISIGIDFWQEFSFPFAEDVPKDPGYENIKNDFLFITHLHADHNFNPSNSPYLIGHDGAGKVKESRKIKKIGIWTVDLFKSNHFPGGSSIYPVENGVFKLYTKNLNIVHMGDSHYTMTDYNSLKELKEKLGSIDILIMPIGFQPKKVVSSAKWDLTMRILKPQIVIPVHYWDIKDKERFIEFCKC